MFVLLSLCKDAVDRLWTVNRFKQDVLHRFNWMVGNTIYLFISFVRSCNRSFVSSFVLNDIHLYDLWLLVYATGLGQMLCSWNVLFTNFTMFRLQRLLLIKLQFKLMKGKALRKHSLHEQTAASVLLKLFISGNEWCHTTDAP